MMNQYNGILTDQSIFRYFFREIGQFRSTWLRFGEDKTMRASREHVDIISTCQHWSVLVIVIGH